MMKDANLNRLGPSLKVSVMASFRRPTETCMYVARAAPKSRPNTKYNGDNADTLTTMNVRNVGSCEDLQLARN